MREILITDLTVVWIKALSLSLLILNTVVSGITGDGSVVLGAIESGWNLAYLPNES